MKQQLRRILATVCACAMLATGASALTVEEAITLLETHYVDDLPAEIYEAQTISDLFKALGDPYTYYMDAESYAEFNSLVENTSSVVGIGTQITYTESGIYIAQIINNGPAEAVGLTVGDLIIAIDGISCVPATEEVGALVRGEAGSQVTLTVQHTDGSVEDYTLTRAEVRITNTNISVLDKHIGFISCTSFGSETADLVRAGLEAHEDEVDVWWLDLRNNAGGMATVAVEMVGMFAGSGIHLYYRDGSDQYYVSLSNEAYLTEHPVIVLTNASSASAAELFAADMRDTTAGISVGSRTYGKGVAQIILDGDNEEEYFTDDAMKVTSYRFFSSATNTTDKIGVIPTVYVSDQYTEGVATLLGTVIPENSEGWLSVNLGGWEWYINLAEAQSPEHAEDFDALLSALAPDVSIHVGASGNRWVQVPVNVALALYGSENCTSRWFNDVDASAYDTELNSLATYGILQGNGDGTFQPGNTLTRAQLCAMLAQAFGITSNAVCPFTDVAEDSWYSACVTAMYYMGMVEGFEDGTFHPDETITNEQFIAIMARLATYLNASLYDVYQELTEDDLTDSRLDSYADWAKYQVQLMLYSEELYPDGALAILYDEVAEIDPSASVLREEAGATLYNLLHATGILRY